MCLPSRPILDPFERHIGYDSEALGLGVHALSPIPEGETPLTAEIQSEPDRQFFCINIPSVSLEAVVF